MKEVSGLSDQENINIIIVTIGVILIAIGILLL
jgi:hypothetical protein